MLSQPFLQNGLAKGAGLKMPVDEGDDGFRLGFQPRAVEPEEDVHAGKGHALVAVNEAVVHREAFPERRRLLDQVRVVAGLWAQQRRLDQAVIADALSAAEQPQLLGVDVKRVIEGEVFHLLRQRLVDGGPALRAFRMKALDGRVDLAARGFRHAAELVRRHDDGDIAPLPLHAHGLGLRHVDQLAETILGVGCGEGFHEGRLAELANLGKIGTKRDRSLKSQLRIAIISGDNMSYAIRNLLRLGEDMKLTKAHATNYRNIIDSNEVDIGQSTCLVGKNEAGKSAFLKALEGLRSTDSTFKRYGKVENYPRRHLADYDENHPDGEAQVISTVWALEAGDIAAVETELGKGVFGARTITVYKTYEDDSTHWSLPISEEAVFQNLVKAHGLNADEAAAISTAKTTQKAAEALQGLAERTTNQESLLTAIGKFRKNSAYLRAIDILSARMPRFMYFSHYDRMSGELSINKLNTDKQSGTPMDSGDRVFLDFLEYAGTTLDDLAAATQFEELNAKCEAAALRITDQIFEYWTQNDELKIKVVFSEGKSGDPEPFNSGPVARARVENGLHGVTVPFSERSAGFIWFFSFLVKFAQIKKSHGNVILLLDEPGLTLHGTAQKDLLRYFAEQIAPHHQLVWTTHSPFMVPADDLASVRTVEDVVQRDKRDRKVSIGTKIRPDVLTTDPQTNFPIFGAMGFEVTQTLLIGTNTLLVEGPSDILYLQAASTALKAAGRTHLSPNWAICPSGGIDKVLPFVRLFYGNKLNVAVLTDYERGQKRKLDDLHKSALLEHDRIILATEIAEKEEADIEDFFDPAFFVDLVNRTYGLKDGHELTVEKLEAADASSSRLVKKAEAYFRLLPDTVPQYSHYDPSLYLLQHAELWKGRGKHIQETLKRFEVAFERIGRFI